MTFWGKNTKLISLFAVVYFCLNAGAFLCLAKCLLPATGEHCPTAKRSEHCEPIEEKKRILANNDCADAHMPMCSALPVGLLGVPAEKRVSPIFALTAAVSAMAAAFEPANAVTIYKVDTFVYRPPPLDRRVERILNCVIRI